MSAAQALPRRKSAPGPRKPRRVTEVLLDLVYYLNATRAVGCRPAPKGR